VKENEIEDIERMNRPDAWDERGFPVTVKRLKRKTAGVSFSALLHELHELVVEVLLARKCLVAELGKAALDSERNARAVKENAGFEAFTEKACSLKEVYEADRAFEGDGVKGDEGLLTRLSLDVREYLLFIVDEIVTFFVRGKIYCRHEFLQIYGPLLSPNSSRVK